MEGRTDNGELLTFAAIDPAIDKIIVSPREKKGGGEWIWWGDRNIYPQYVKGLCREVPTLRTVVLGFIDYVCGDDVVAQRGLRDGLAFDRKGTTAAQVVKRTAKSIAELGGFAWKITRNNDRSIGELEVLPMENIRANEDADVFFYSEKWDKGYGGREVITYPAFSPDYTDLDESILFVKIWGDGTYPEPVYAASVKACETERGVDDFHLGNIERGFMGSYMVCFNNGNPADKIKKEVERSFTAKFAGKRNAGRIMFAWAADREHQATLQKMEVADYGEKYATLSKHCQQQIFTAFRANPNLFGCASEGQTGFNTEEYDSAFRLFNRTMVKPVQRAILDAFALIMGQEGVVTITPFTLDGGDNIVR